MFRRMWRAIPVLAAGVLLALPAGAEDTRDTQAELADLLLADGMTHEEVAVELLRALDGAELAQPDCVPGEEMFDDVPASNPFCSFIEELARRGITTGCDDDNFCPGATVSRAQMATFIVRAIEATQTSSAFAASDQEVPITGGPISLLDTVIVDVPSGGGAVTATATLEAIAPPGGFASCFILMTDGDDQGSASLVWGTPTADQANLMTFVHSAELPGGTFAVLLQCFKDVIDPNLPSVTVGQRNLSVIATPLSEHAAQ